MVRRVVLGIVLAGFLIAPSAWAASYKIDPQHSTVGFKVRHLLSWTRGQFGEFEGTIQWDPQQPTQWATEATIQAASLDTRVPDRDKHLRSRDFFDVEQFPTITFKSTKISNVQGNQATLHGVLTLHGVEKPITLDLELLGEVADPWGNVKAGFVAETTIDRKDFGIVWNEQLDTGGVVVGEEVQIILEIEAYKQT